MWRRDSPWASCQVCGVLVIAPHYLAFEATGQVPMVERPPLIRVPGPIVHTARTVSGRRSRLLGYRVSIEVRGDPAAEDPGPAWVGLPWSRSKDILARIAASGFRLELQPRWP